MSIKIGDIFFPSFVCIFKRHLLGRIAQSAFVQGAFYHIWLPMTALGVVSGVMGFKCLSCLLVLTWIFAKRSSIGSAKTLAFRV